MRRDVVFAAVLLGLVQQDLWLNPDLGHRVGPRAVVACCYLVTTAALAWRRRAPVWVLAVVWGVSVAQDLAYGAPESLGAFLPPLVALYSAGRWAPPRTGVPALALSLVGMAVHEWRDPLFSWSAGPTYFFWSLLAAAWPLGQAFRRRELRIGSLAAQAESLELASESSRREAIAAERARIARDLHDVVGHGLSVVVLQLEATLGLLDEHRPAEARARVASSQDSARQALGEMRRLVGLLDEDEAPAALAPQPGLAQVAQLVADTRAAGADVLLSCEGAAVQLPAGLDLAAFRVVQEALTNVLRHARPAKACVRVRYGAELVVEVTDAGQGPYGVTNGRGIAGMRERVSMYGGDLLVGPLSTGGFRVRATFPVESGRS